MCAELFIVLIWLTWTFCSNTHRRMGLWNPWLWHTFFVTYPWRCGFAVKKVKADIALPGNPVSELWDVTCRMGSHSVTCHPTQVNAPSLTPAGTRFIYPGRMEVWVDLVDLIAPRPGVEPATFPSWVWRRTAAPMQNVCHGFSSYRCRAHAGPVHMRCAFTHMWGAFAHLKQQTLYTVTLPTHTTVPIFHIVVNDTVWTWMSAWKKPITSWVCCQFSVYKTCGFAAPICSYTHSSLVT